MQITEIAFSSYAVTDFPRAREFYEGVLQLKVTSETNLGEQGHWIEYDIGPGTLGIGRAPGWKPSPDGCTVALEVANFEEAVAALKAANATIKMGPFETPVCHMIMVSDPDHNTIILHKRKPGHH
ncbi:MAG TPA: VOC family protein [Chthoniobacteraceae bacterium]|jgi:predicted enzyme related to lactoylglutathione lyase|nr:VOC family protein [Chthoniobacteraceae bacterium]